MQHAYTISVDYETVGPLRKQIYANLCMNKIYSQGEYYICHFKRCNANLGDFHTICLINILRTELRTKMIPARPQSVGNNYQDHYTARI